MIYNAKTAVLKNRKNRGEVNTLPSETQPDQTLTIREIMLRYVKGMPVSASHREPVYNEDIEFDNIKGLDLTEVDDLKEKYQNEINHKQKFKNELEQEKSKRDRLERDRQANKERQVQLQGVQAGEEAQRKGESTNPKPVNYAT